MSLTSRLFGNVNAQRALSAVTAPDSQPRDHHDNDAAGAAAALSFAPVKRTALDLFARAPQACKPSRRDKRRLAQTHAQQQHTAGTTTTTATGGSGSGKAASPFDVVLVAPDNNDNNDDGSARGRTGDRTTPRSAATLRVATGARTAASSTVAHAHPTHIKPPRHRLLRHALHTNAEEDARTVFVGNLPNTITKREVHKLFKSCGAVQSVRVRCQALVDEDEGEGEGGGNAKTTATAAATGTTTAATTTAASKTTAKSRTVGRAVRVLRGDVKKDDTYSATAYVLFRPVDDDHHNSNDAHATAAATTGGGGRGRGGAHTPRGGRGGRGGAAAATHPAVVAALEKNGVLFRDRHLVVTTLDVHARVYAPETSVFLGNLAYTTTEEHVWSFFAQHGIADVKRVRLVRDRDSGKCKGFGYVEFLHRRSVEPAIALRGLPLDGRDVRIVHVNKAKEVKAVTPSRREQRSNRRSSNSNNSSGAAQSAQAQQGRRLGQKRSRRDDDGDDDTSSSARAARRVSDEVAHPWMGVVTNPRRKIPRDLRPLAEGGGNNRAARRAVRAPVKHKMRNPEKHARKATRKPAGAAARKSTGRRPAAS